MWRREVDLWIDSEEPGAFPDEIIGVRMLKALKGRAARIWLRMRWRKQEESACPDGELIRKLISQAV